MSDEATEKRFLFDFYIHEAETVNMRADWFLIFHAILFEAFVTAQHSLSRITLGTLGCIVSYVWLVVGIRQTWDLKHVARCIWDKAIMGPETANLFRRLFEAREKYQPPWMRWARSTPAFCIVLPSTCLLAWLVLITTAREGRFGWEGLVVAITALIAMTVFYAKLGSGPNVDDDTAVAHLRPTESFPMTRGLSTKL